MYTSTIHELEESALLDLAIWWYNEPFTSLKDVVEYIKKVIESHGIQWDKDISDTSDIKNFLSVEVNNAYSYTFRDIKDFLGNAYKYTFTNDHHVIPPLKNGIQCIYVNNKNPLWVASYVDDEMDIVYKEFYSEDEAQEFLRKHTH